MGRVQLVLSMPTVLEPPLSSLMRLLVGDTCSHVAALSASQRMSCPDETLQADLRRSWTCVLSEECSRSSRERHVMSSGFGVPLSLPLTTRARPRPHPAPRTRTRNRAQNRLFSLSKICTVLLISSIFSSLSIPSLIAMRKPFSLL